MCHTILFLALVSCSSTKWQNLLPPEEGREPRQTSLYSTLVPYLTADFSWQLLHGAKSAGIYLAWFMNSLTPVFLW